MTVPTLRKSIISCVSRVTQGEHSMTSMGVGSGELSTATLAQYPAKPVSGGTGTQRVAGSAAQGSRAARGSSSAGQGPQGSVPTVFLC
jgi:hypothetical protein